MRWNNSIQTPASLEDKTKRNIPISEEKICNSRYLLALAGIIPEANSTHGTMVKGLSPAAVTTSAVDLPPSKWYGFTRRPASTGRLGLSRRKIAKEKGHDASATTRGRGAKRTHKPVVDKSREADTLRKIIRDAIRAQASKEDGG